MVLITPVFVILVDTVMNNKSNAIGQMSGVTIGDWYIDEDNILWVVYICSSTYVRLAHESTIFSLYHGDVKDDKGMTVEEFFKAKANYQH